MSLRKELLQRQKKHIKQIEENILGMTNPEMKKNLNKLYEIEKRNLELIQNMKTDDKALKFLLDL